MLLLVSGNWHTLAKLETELKKLSDATGITVSLRRTEQRAPRKDVVTYSVDVVCLDQPGIVHNLAGFFSSRGIDIAELNTRSYAAAHTGAPMFSVQMVVHVPAKIHIAALREEFMDLCDQLNLDAILEPVKPKDRQRWRRERLPRSTQRSSRLGIASRAARDRRRPATTVETGSRDAAGKKLVLYFYPKDNTTGCTLEGQAFRDLHAAFRRPARDHARRLARQRRLAREVQGQDVVSVRAAGGRGQAGVRALRRLEGKEHVRAQVHGRRAQHVPDRRRAACCARSGAK